MFGWHYKTICPFCNHVYEADHGITAHVQIRNHGDLWYIEERCPRCEKNYYRCLIDDYAFFLRLSGVKEDDAVNEAVRRCSHYYRSIRSTISSGVIDSIKKRYKEAYSITDKDLFVDCAFVSKEDLTAVTGCCY